MPVPRQDGDVVCAASIPANQYSRNCRKTRALVRSAADQEDAVPVNRVLVAVGLEWEEEAAPVSPDRRRLLQDKCPAGDTVSAGDGGSLSAPLSEGEPVKKIAFSTYGSDLSAELDPRFGRAQQFLVYDLAQQQFSMIQNQQARSASQGAGIQAAETIVRSGIDTLVTGHCGPKAFKVLEAAGVAVYNCSAATVQEALQQLQGGVLTPAGSADVEGHW